MTNLQRATHADTIKQTLENQGYTTQIYTLSWRVGWRIKFFICFLLPSYITRISYLDSLHLPFTIPDSSAEEFVIACIIGIFSLPIHEGLHGITWCLFCKNRWKSIDAGDRSYEETPFFYCLEPIGPRPFIWGQLLPFIVLGLGPYIAAALLGSIPFVWLGVFNTAFSMEDLAIALMLRKYKPSLVLHHPTATGFLAFDKTPAEPPHT